MMNCRIIPENRSALRMLVFVMCTALLVACGDTLSHFSSYHHDLDVKGINYAAADRLIQNAGHWLDYSTPVYGKALRRSGDRKDTRRRIAPFAGVVIEQAARRMKRHGYNVQPAAETGEKIRNGLVLSGIYTPKARAVEVELILKKAGNGREVSSFSYSIERSFKTDKLLRTRPVRNEAKELMDQVIRSF